MANGMSIAGETRAANRAHGAGAGEFGGEAAGAGAATGATGGGEAFRSVLERSAKAGRERHAHEARSREGGAHAQRERRTGEVEPREDGASAAHGSRADEGEAPLHERGDHERRAGKVDPRERAARAARERGADEVEVEPREGGASEVEDEDADDGIGERGARMSADVLDPAALGLALAALAQGATPPAPVVATAMAAGNAMPGAEVALVGQGAPGAALATSPDPSTARTADASDASAAIDRDGALDSLIDESTIASAASRQADAKRASALPRSPDASPAPPLTSAPRDAGATPTAPLTLSATASTTTLPPGAAALSPATAAETASLAAAASLTTAASAASLPARSSLKPPAPSGAAALSSLTGATPTLAPTAVARADTHSAQPRGLPEAPASPTAIPSRSTLDAGPLSASSSSDASSSPSPDLEKPRSQPDVASDPRPFATATASADADAVAGTISSAATTAATTTFGAVLPASPSAPAPRAISAALGDEAPHDQLRAELRQRDVAVGVSRMALRHETRAEAHIPDFGHIAVATRPRGAEVDVRVSAREPVAERALQEASRALESHLRTGAIPLGQLAIGGGGASSSHGAPGERQKPPPPPADSAAASPHKAAKTASDPGPMRRVRIVL